MSDPSDRKNSGGQGAAIDVSRVERWDAFDVSTLTQGDFDRMTLESLSYLRAIVRSVPTGRQMGAGIAAAKHVLDFVAWRAGHDLAERKFALAAREGSDEKTGRAAQLDRLDDEELELLAKFAEEREKKAKVPA